MPSPIASRKRKAAPKRKIDVERRAQIGQEKRARTRVQFLEAAFSLLGHERGLTTRIEEICSTAGVARGTFYSYFTGMDDLFDALSYELNHEFNRAVVAIITEMPNASERVAAATRYYLERALKDPQWAWAMVNISAGGPLFGAESSGHAQRTIEEGIALGEFALTTPESGRDLTLGVAFAAMITLLRSPPPPNYPASIARHLLLALGVPSERVEDIITRPLRDPMIGPH